MIEFKNTSPEAHSITFKGETAPPAVPKYIFSKQEDFEDFQSELRGKRLEATFDVRKISTASSAKYGDATKQQLKIWHDLIKRECSVSYYASVIKDSHHREFPLVMFEQELGVDKTTNEKLTLNFALLPEPKRARTYSSAFSRSPTEATTATNTTGKPNTLMLVNHYLTDIIATSIFSSSRTEVASRASSIGTSSTSRTTNGMEGISERSEPEQSLKLLAKSMKYLKIEFWDEAGE